MDRFATGPFRTFTSIASTKIAAYTSPRRRADHSFNSSMTLSMIRNVVSFEIDARQICTKCAPISPAVSRFAYSDSETSSTLFGCHRHFFTVYGSNVPSRRLGASIVTIRVASVDTFLGRVEPRYMHSPIHDQDRNGSPRVRGARSVLIQSGQEHVLLSSLRIPSGPVKARPCSLVNPD